MLRVLLAHLEGVLRPPQPDVARAEIPIKCGAVHIGRCERERLVEQHSRLFVLLLALELLHAPLALHVLAHHRLNLLEHLGDLFGMLVVGFALGVLGVELEQKGAEVAFYKAIEVFGLLVTLHRSQERRHLLRPRLHLLSGLFLGFRSLRRLATFELFAAFVQFILNALLLLRGVRHAVRIFQFCILFLERIEFVLELIKPFIESVLLLLQLRCGGLLFLGFFGQIELVLRKLLEGARDFLHPHLPFHLFELLQGAVKLLLQRFLVDFHFIEALLHRIKRLLALLLRMLRMLRLLRIPI